MHSTNPPLDPGSVRDILEPYPGRDPDPRPGGWLASVALVLRPARDGSELLIIKRGRLDRDPWSGHMALPGGRMEAHDESLLRTAIRETHEEVGIDLDEAGRTLGRLERVEPVSTALPTLTVVPFVFGVSTGTEARIASREVAEFHWVPLGHLRSPDNRTIHRLHRSGREHTFPAIDVAGRTVWGLTHRILSDFLERLPGIEPSAERDE